MTLREFTLIADGTAIGTKVFDENGIEVKGVRYISIEQDAGGPPLVTLHIVGLAKFESAKVPE